MTELLKQGAEGKIYVGEYNGQKCLIKERFIKTYRHSELDAQITKERMRAEAKAISRCAAAGINVPKIFHTDFKNRKIYIEFFDRSIPVKIFINNTLNNFNQSEQLSALKNLCSRIGKIIAKLHTSNIIHGDLTTSNILLDPKEELFTEYNIILIDFGLSHYSQSPEDKGVDLYVLERALLSTHSNLPHLFETILEAYKTNTGEEKCKEIIDKYEEVRARE